MYTVRKVRNLDSALDTLIQLDRQCFPGDDPFDFTYRRKSHHWWIAYDEDDTPVAFAGSLFWEPDKGFYLCRAGTLPQAQGQGLQKRFIQARVDHAKRSGAKWCYTYTLASNHISSNNLIKKGFLLFRPGVPWVGTTGVLYWYRTFRKP